MGHAISKFGESKERVKTAQETIHKMTSEIVKFMDVCKKLVFDRLNAVENLFKVSFYHKLIHCIICLFFSFFINVCIGP